MPKIKKVTEFNRSEVKRLGDAIEKAVEEVGRKHGVHIKRGNARFDSSSCTYKTEASLIGADGEVRSPEAEAFKKYAHMYGLKVEDFGRSFTTFGGKVYTICGLNMRAPKRPIHATNRNGKTFIFPSEEVKAMLERS